MKYLISLIALLLATTITAQSVFFDPDHRKSEILDILSISEDEYVIASKSSFDVGTNLEWFKGDTLYRLNNITNDIAILDLKQTDEGILVEAYSYLECDVLTPGYKWFYLDTLSTVSTYVDYSNNALPNFVNVKRVRDNAVVVIEGFFDSKRSTGLRIFEDDNNVVVSDLPNDKITEIVEIGDVVFVYGYEYLYMINTSSEVFDSLVYEYQMIHQVVATDDPKKIAILADFQVDIIDLETSEVISYPVGVGDGGPISIIYTDQLYLLRSREEMLSEVQFINEEGQWETSYYDFFYLALYDQMYKMFNGEIWLAGRYVGNSFGYKGAYIVKKLINLEDEPNDLSIQFIGANSNASNAIELSVIVKNKSDREVKDVHVYSTTLSNFFCKESYFNAHLQTISSGEEITITQEITLFNEGSYSGDVCFYTLGSGRNLDFDFYEDNYSCALITNTNDLVKNSVINIYPNPVDNILYIEGIEEGKTFQIYGFNGALIGNFKYKDGINTEQLSAGIYLIADPEKSYWNRKFIKN